MQNDEIVSSDRFMEFVGSTIFLTRDMGSFVIQKTVELLPEEYRGLAQNYTAQLAGSSSSIFNATISALHPTLALIVSSLRRGYEELNRQSAQVIDPLVREFEKQYPSSAGKVGSNLFDRFLLIMWLLSLVRLTFLSFRLVRRLIFGRSSRNRRPTTVTKSFRADPIFGNPVTPPQNKQFGTSSVSASENATPEKHTEPPPALRTVKKRIVISR
jgi:hypothetical protein